jgi:hypothetical protein
VRMWPHHVGGVPVLYGCEAAKKVAARRARPFDCQEYLKCVLHTRVRTQSTRAVTFLRAAMHSIRGSGRGWSLAMAARVVPCRRRHVRGQVCSLTLCALSSCSMGFNRGSSSSRFTWCASRMHSCVMAAEPAAMRVRCGGGGQNSAAIEASTHVATDSSCCNDRLRAHSGAVYKLK